MWNACNENARLKDTCSYVAGVILSIVGGSRLLYLGMYVYVAASSRLYVDKGDLRTAEGSGWNKPFTSR